MENWERRWEDYYLLLGILPTADTETVTAVYRRLARKYGVPGGSEPDEAKFRLLNAARDVLTDAAKRDSYDRSYRTRSAPGGPQKDDPPHQNEPPPQSDMTPPTPGGPQPRSGPFAEAPRGSAGSGTSRSSTSARKSVAIIGGGVGAVIVVILIVSKLGGGGQSPPSTSGAAATSTGVSATVAATPTGTLVPLSPTPTATPQPTPRSTQIAPAVLMTDGLPYSPRTPTTGGAITVNVTGVQGAVRGAYFDVYQTKQDARGQPVRGDNVTGDSTDNTGGLSLSVPAGTYIVTSNLQGVNWGTLQEQSGVSGVVVEPGKTTQLDIRLGRIKLVITTVDGIVRGQYIDIYTQAADAGGRAVLGRNITGDSTDNTGIVGFDLVPGRYIVASNITGVNWGDLAERSGKSNVAVDPAKATVLTVNLGRLIVVSQNYVDVYLQDASAGGGPVRGRNVTGNGPGNLGQVQFDLVAGTYAVVTSNQTAFNVVVKEGQVTKITP